MNSENEQNIHGLMNQINLVKSERDALKASERIKDEQNL